MRSKKEQTHIKTFRVNQDLKDFLDSLENSNQFVIQLLKDTQEFKEFLHKKELMNDKNQPSLFDEM
ncbi:hypothetical protein CQA38_08455 [Campylobacter sp. MIT 12-5580]|uniref:hypothetical protein n=1 Tax=unclassified Campylobacter TaxID=2593542 RepID=UPI0010F52B42|nr:MULTISPECIES: hypothetical protein [unclassified Campylobacter]NDJ28035.1 hypothetical protein [Campylobacter sp. MIT 19-121]NDJ28040.1 hypothetical protein [Campylobacter sp. MIT 19-121]TKX28268.1 hypothetical protein CQA38_08455 [Campylobacter sp. MIT 12-5580]